MHRYEHDTVIHWDLHSISSTGLADGFGRWSCPTAARSRRIHPKRWVPGSRGPTDLGIRRGWPLLPMKGRSPTGKWDTTDRRGQSKAKATKAPEDLPAIVKEPLPGRP